MRQSYWTRKARLAKARRAIFVGVSLWCRWTYLTLRHPWTLENLKDVWLRMNGLIEDAIVRQTDPVQAMIRTAHREIRDNNRAAAQASFDRAIEMNPADPEAHLLRAAVLTYLEGNPRKLFKELVQGVSKAHSAARSLGLDRVKVRILGDDFGGMHATVLDGVIKLKKLGLMDNEHIMVIRKSAVGNLAYLNCWRTHIPIFITNDNNYYAIKSLLSPIFEEISALDCKSGIVPLYEAFNVALNGWGDSPPLLALTPEQRAAGDQVLEKVGISSASWFAGLHVREGAKGGQARSGPDADITTYAQAIERITSRGGWVIRMGIGGTPISPMNQVWDYANSQYQSDWMDVYLWGACRFFVGTSSGPVWVPPTFGKPVVLTNATTLGLTLNFANSLIVPKLLWSKRKNRHLTFCEMFEGPYAWSVRPDYDEGDVELVSNTPEELALAVEEMMARVEAPAAHAQLTHRQQILEGIRFAYVATSQARVCDSFLKLHADLIA